MALDLEFIPISVAPPDARIAGALEAMALAQIAQANLLEEIKETLEKIAEKAG